MGWLQNILATVQTICRASRLPRHRHIWKETRDIMDSRQSSRSQKLTRIWDIIGRINSIIEKTSLAVGSFTAALSRGSGLLCPGNGFSFNLLSLLLLFHLTDLGKDHFAEDGTTGGLAQAPLLRSTRRRIG